MNWLVNFHIIVLTKVHQICRKNPDAIKKIVKLKLQIPVLIISPLYNFKGKLKKLLLIENPTMVLPTVPQPHFRYFDNSL